MSITRTYSTSPGAVSISDPDLAFATVYNVERTGTEYDENFGNRGYVHNFSFGTITFPVAFEYGETVTVWFEPGLGPVIVCTPVSGSLLMPTGIESIPYLYDAVLSGTAPFALTINDKPSWMTIEIVGDHILFYGTPLTDGVYQVDIVISNCTGGSTYPFASDIQIYEEPDPVDPDTGGAMQITVDSVFSKILAVGGFAYTLSSGSLPLNNGQSAVGVFTTFVGQVKVTVNTVILSRKLQLIRNDIVLQEKLLNAGSSNVQTFISFSFNSTHVMKIKLISA